MPYIDKVVRERLDSKIKDLLAQILLSGELNYVITRLAAGFLMREGLNYSRIAEVIGTLKLVSSEIEWRMVRIYEGWKVIKNGDVKEFEDMNEVSHENLSGGTV